MRVPSLLIRSVLTLLVFALVSMVGPRVAAQTRRPSVGTASGGVVRGMVTTQNGTIPLGGVVVKVSVDGSPVELAVASESDGAFRIDGLETGQYRVSASLEGFEPFSQVIDLAYNETEQVTIDLRFSTVAQRVDVVATSPVVPTGGTLAGGQTISTAELEEISPGDGGLQGALKLLASVIEVPGGLSIKGGLPNQASVQIGPGTFVDPATGLSHARMPDDAIDTVDVLPNPYAVEFGRFSSGLVVIQTRRAADTWRTRLNNLDPTLRTERHEPLHVVGIASYSPRIEVGGPLIRDRLYLQHAAQYRYRASDVPSRPQDELRRSHALSAFTRVDANLTDRHSLEATVGVFPAVSKWATLGTFTPPEATADLHSNVLTTAVTGRSVWGDAFFTETTVEANTYHALAQPQGGAPMELLPENTVGNFFNRHDRTTATYQVVETVSGSAMRRSILHLFKGGIDLLHNRYDSSSVSRPILIRRPDGTLARRLDFGPATSQSVPSTDVALFAQDRVQPTDRWHLEFGGRLDRDGITGRWNVTPRVGSAVLLNASGTAVLRGGLGLFFERTPSAVGAFEQYESYVETRYAGDGVTPIGPPVAFVHVTGPDLRTSRSLTWDLAYDHRLSAEWTLHAGIIDRFGSHEPIVEPVRGGVDSRLLLSSSGESRYREGEFGVHFTRGTALDVNASYVRAMARADLNAFTGFFDSVRAPVLGENAYASARSEVPHRLLMRGRAMPTPRWLLVGVVDWRAGLPYSTVDESLDFVGPRNSRRFPTFVRIDLGVEHRFRIYGLQPWIGLRIDNVLNAFLPRDVQSNIASPDFGTFYNPEFRQFRIQFRFGR